MKYLFLGFSMLIACFNSFAQTPLPNYLTEEEKIILVSKTDISKQAISTPPDFEVRTPAEWEEANTLVLAWPNFYWEILREITRAAVEEVEVIIFANNPTNIENYLINGGVDVSNVTILDEDFDSVWIRDYGQWSIYKNDVEDLHLVDWLYNRPRADDDVLPVFIADYFDLDLYETTTAPYDMVNTGGNFMTDGMGTGFASSLVLDENDGSGPSNIFYPTHTEEEIDDILSQFMGIDRYIKMETLPYDAIHHIDMHMKLLDEETILVAEYPTGVADGPQIEENIQYIQDNFLSSFGTPYEFVRIPAPAAANGNYPDNNGDYRTFTNSLFINKTVIVPVYGSDLQETALDIYREQLPGYNIVGIDCNDIIPAFGALHCITKLIHTDDPMWIVHQALEDVNDVDENYPVEALIRHSSEIEAAQLYYRTNLDEEYTVLSMENIDSDSSVWLANIPLQLDSTKVQYYIEGVSNSGKTMVRPMTAPEGYWEFNIYNGLTAEDTISTSIENIDLNEFAVIQGIYPNPAKDFITVSLGQKNLSGEIYIVDSKGTIQTQKSLINNNNEILTIPLNEVPAGLYFLKFQNENNVEEIHKFIVE